MVSNMLILFPYVTLSFSLECCLCTRGLDTQLCVRTEAHSRGGSDLRTDVVLEFH